MPVSPFVITSTRNGVDWSLSRRCMAFDCAPRIICLSKCSHWRRADAVAAHMDLLGFGEELAVGDVADDVVAWKPLDFVLL